MGIVDGNASGIVVIDAQATQHMLVYMTLVPDIQLPNEEDAVRLDVPKK